MEKYDEPTQAFLSLFPEEVTSDEAKVEELLTTYQEDPSAFDQLFQDAGIDLEAMGIVSKPKNTSLEEVESGSGNTTSSSSMTETLNDLFKLGSELLINSGIMSTIPGANGNREDATTSSEDKNEVSLAGGSFVFNTSDIYESLGLEDGMAQVAAYFGIDHSNPDELDIFVNSFGTCEFCDNKDINLDKTFAGRDCSDWLMFSMFSKEDECSVLRAAAVQSCGCSTKELAITPETRTCDLCPGSSIEGVRLDQRIPTMSDELLCRNLLDIRAVEGSKTCDAVSGFAYICGCTGTTPQCNLCPDGSSPSRPEAELKVGSATVTCAEYDESLWMNTKSTCPSAIQELQKGVGLDPISYCGCPNVEKPLFGCRPCRPGFKIRDDLETDLYVSSIQMTCQKWADEWAPFTVNEDICQQTQAQVNSECCTEMTQEEIEAEETERASILAAAAAARKETSSAPVSHDFTVFVAFQVAILMISHLTRY